MTAEEIILAGLIDEIGRKIKKQLGNCELCHSDEYSIRDLTIVDFIGKNKKTMGDIAEELELTPGTITPIVDKLIENKILKRERDETIDRRKVFISLDKKGENIYNKHLESKLKIANIMMKAFSRTEKQETIDLMKKISTNLDKVMED